MASYAVSLYPRPVVKPGPLSGCDTPLRNGPQPSYSPDTPFSFYSDAYSDYGDEQCLSSFEHLADADALDTYGVPDADRDVQRVLSIWDATWYGNASLDDGLSDARSPRAASTPGEPEQPTSRGSALPRSPPVVNGPATHVDQRRPAHIPPPAAANRPVPTDLRAQPSRSDAESAISNSLTTDTGTWKQRQFIAPDPEPLAHDHPATPGTLPAQIPNPRDIAKPKVARAAADDEEDDDAVVAAAAWRWRFTRRWKAEQARAVNPQLATSNEDAVADALLYLTAVGPNTADLSRTTSDVSEGPLRQSLGMGSTGGLLGMEFVQDSCSTSSQPALLAAADKQARANEHVARFAKQAQHLLQQQRELERRAEQRAREQQESPCWVGDLLDVVEIDDWGKFRFVLLRVKDEQGRHKLVLRGRNYAQEELLASQCRQQVADLAAQHRLRPGTVELQGCGVMEWRRDRDRHLHLSCSRVYQCTGVSMAPKDLGRMAAILAKKHLPIHYKVAADGTYVA